MITSVNMDQIDDLEVIFATLTEVGWVIPDWLKYLRNVVVKSYTDRD